MNNKFFELVFSTFSVILKMRWDGSKFNGSVGISKNARQIYFCEKKGPKRSFKKKKQRKLLFLTEISEGNLIINEVCSFLISRGDFKIFLIFSL